jgi:hypothetical protein
MTTQVIKGPLGILASVEARNREKERLRSDGAAAQGMFLSGLVVSPQSSGSHGYLGPNPPIIACSGSFIPPVTSYNAHTSCTAQGVAQRAGSSIDEEEAWGEVERAILHKPKKPLLKRVVNFLTKWIEACLGKIF